MSSNLVRVFCSYCHRDQDLKEELEAHLESLKLGGRISVVWNDELMAPGDAVDPTIRQEIDRAQLILLLVSSDYLHSQYCWFKEAQHALDRHDAGLCRTIPVIMRDVHWTITRLGKYAALPRNGMAVSRWDDRDAALRHVTEEIDKILRELPIVSVSGYRPAPQISTSTSPLSDTEFSCRVQCDGSVILRADGFAEGIGDLVLRFTGDPGEHRIGDVWLYFSAPVTSRIEKSRLTEALLFPATKETVSHLPVLGRGIRGVLLDPNAVAFLHVPFHELRALPVGERNLRISGLRINARESGFPKDGNEGSVEAFVRISQVYVDPPGGVTIAKVRHDLNVSILSAYERDHGSECVKLRPNEMMFDGHGTLTPVSLSFLIRFSGRLAGFEQASAQRTRLILRLLECPRCMQIFATTCSIDSWPPQLEALMTLSDAAGYGPFESATSIGFARYSSQSFPIAEIKLSDGAGHVVWEISEGGLEEHQSLMFGVVVACERSVGSAHTVWAEAGFAPQSTATRASSSSPIPRFDWSIKRFRLFSIESENSPK